ncbi:bestrophin family protein [Chitinophaga jiangningensis]|nr:bestrophin family ion channel [Chitinophaga jiangningensis]
MHIGKSYKITDFLFWTRSRIYTLLILDTLPLIFYQLLGMKWIALPWVVVALLGTATAFIVGFKNTQTYNRTDHGHVIWANISNLSKSWGMMCRDYFQDKEFVKVLLNRHFAWLTALRYSMRENRVWEVADAGYNAEYQRYYRIPERQIPLATALLPYLPADELAAISWTQNKATQLLALQSKAIKEAFDAQQIVPLQYLEMQRTVNNLLAQQGHCESLKDTPYPRQYAIINNIFVAMFCILLPFGLLREFDMLNDTVSGMMKGHMIWLLLPFSVIISWLYTTLEQVGESTENPFEGSANDVPISQICRAIEIDIREILGETELPAPILPQHDILV